MFQRPLVHYSVLFPESLRNYLHGLNFEVVAFLKEVLPEFWLLVMHYLTPPMRDVYVGATLTNMGSFVQVVCSVGTSELTPGGELSLLLASDLYECIQLALRCQLRDQGVEPNLNLLNLLQVFEDPDFFQPI
ncbi:E4 ORF2 [Simian adenovirus ch1]|nr:E4 ORF2 [Simian adenovirus ch1]